jgi:chemotaxis signal transduction protein/CheY-like chemotaxis protein/ABC-type nitrate/sulfonate/bicarbonate transport system substrate-binding protein
MAVDPGIKILLAEDAGTMRKMEVRILNQLGFKNITEAKDGNDAVEKLQASPDFDLVISDWAMPGMDGYEFLKWIRGQEQFKSLPFLMATGHGDKEYTATAMESGASGVVAKPFTPDELRILIDKAFGIEEAPDEAAEELPEMSDEGKVHLRMAHIQITDHLTLGVLKHQIATGQKTPRHFELETLCMPSWNPVQDALEKGTVAGAFILAPAAMDLFSYGIPINLVLFAHRNGSIMVRNKVGKYQPPYQQFFKHKSFFIPHKMSIHNMLAHMYFTKMGLRPGVAGSEAVNVLFDVVPPVQMPNFLGDNPDACGFMVAEPIGSRAIASGVAEKQLLSSELWDNHPCCVVVFREEFIRDHGEAVQEFVNMAIEAGQFIREDLDASAQIAVSFLDPKKELGLKKGLLKNVLSDPKGIRTDDLYPVKADLETIQDYMVSKMGVGRRIDLDRFVVTRFADEAAVAGIARGAAARAAAGTGAAVLAVEDAKRTREGKYLIFSLGDERYGIGILDVREIIGMMPITKMPQMPAAFKGVINLRGRVIPVLDMRKKFGMEEMEYNARTCIVISEVSGLSGSTLVGGIVDSVSEVFHIKEGEVEDAPNFGASFDGDFILGMAKTEKGVIILLEIDRILHATDVVQLAQAV